MSEIVIQVPGSTSNLSHGFDCMGMAVAAHNRIAVTTRDDAAVTTPDSADPGLQVFAEKVHRECTAAWDVKLPGIEVRVSGNVPISRGMGSSATVLLGIAAACQRLAGHPLDREELVHLGVRWEGHPDNICAACLGGFTIAAQGSDGLHWQRIAAPDALRAVIAIPATQQSTNEARGVLPDSLSRAEAVRGWQRSCLITAALATGEIERLRGLLGDGWHEQYRAPLNPGLREAQVAADHAGALGTILSGSGSCVLGFATVATQEAVAAAFAGVYRKLGIACEVRQTGFDNAGLVPVQD
ncbi:MAG: homoserine kinase [Planctomycetota bacterium]|jgi:homoserine kinase|nr:homoserine kinase [Planctomycetota bacterium]